MATHPCFDTLDRALTALHAGQPREALALAEAATRLLHHIPGAPPQAAVVESWHGYLNATVAGRLTEGLAECREAAQTAFWEPRVFAHLARLELSSGSRRRAIDAVSRGLALARDDRELLELRRSLGVRRPPVFGFLDRDHLLNRWAGMLRGPSPPPALS